MLMKLYFYLSVKLQPTLNVSNRITELFYNKFLVIKAKYNLVYLQK